MSKIYYVENELNAMRIVIIFLLQGFKNGFEVVIQRYVLAKHTPARPNKKKAKGRVERHDNHGKLLRTNASIGHAQ